MKILLFGKNGQVGWELQRSLAPLGEVIALDRAGDTTQGLCGDLTDLAGIVHTIAIVRPDVIVNAAAYTTVDKAESEPLLAQTINVDAPAVMAKAAASLGAWLVHYSTDYVFDGSGDTPWAEDAPTAPLSVYGASKLAGEQAITAALPDRHLILRTSWVFAARGGNFAKTMLRLAQERDAMKVIHDQYGAPTGAELLADTTAHIVRTVGLSQPKQLAGIYHLAASGTTTWFDYAQFVLHNAQKHGITLRVPPQAVQAVPATDFPLPAPRPYNSRLNCSKLQQTFGLNLPDWQAGVARMLQEVLV